MCYSGECIFENDQTGDCMIYNYDKFLETYGFGACIVGGHIEGDEDETFYNEHKELFDEIYDKWDQTERGGDS